MEKIYIISGIIGSLCFALGDILLGYVDPTPLGEGSGVITRGHGKGYPQNRFAVTLGTAAIGIVFLYLGMTHIGDIAVNEAWKQWISFSFSVMTFTWMMVHIFVTVCAFVYHWTAENVSEEKALDALKQARTMFIPMMIISYLLMFVGDIFIIAAIAMNGTILPKYYIAFTPLIGAAVMSALAKINRKSPFCKMLDTLCLNFGLIVWFISLLFTAEV